MYPLVFQACGFSSCTPSSTGACPQVKNMQKKQNSLFTQVTFCSFTGQLAPSIGLLWLLSCASSHCFLYLSYKLECVVIFRGRVSLRKAILPLLQLNAITLKNLIIKKVMNLTLPVLVTFCIFFFFFLPYLQHVKAPGLGHEPKPQLRPTPQL